MSDVDPRSIHKPQPPKPLIPDGQQWHLHHGDCIPHMATLPDACFDFSVFSPPFPSVFAYTDKHEDIGNSEDLSSEGKLHLSFFYRQIRRLIKPGRVMMVHVTQIPRMKRTGGKGMIDFRGLNIRLAARAGFIFEYDWLVPRNPQAQALRTKSRELQFVGLETDRSRSRGAMPDYLLKFVAPGENKVPIDSENEVTRNEWIAWAESAWYGIRETDTLNTKAAKSEEDVKHICPLQLPVIDRLVRLYSNPGEIVFSPFAGISSEMYQSVLRGRRAYGCELKDGYVEQARKNLARAELNRQSEVSGGLFANASDDDAEPTTVSEVA